MECYDIIKSAVITEKTTICNGNKNKFTFVVAMNVNKKQIASFVSRIFKTKVLTVNSMICKGQKVRFKGRVGRQQNRKKIIVTTENSIKLDLSK